MMRGSRLSRAALIGAPLVMLLIGGGTGWSMRDTASGTESSTAVTVVGATVPADLDQFAPEQRIGTPPNPAVIDPSSIIEFQPAGTIEVPPTAALDLPLVAGGSAEVVDAVTHRPATATAAAPRDVAIATGLTALPALATPVSTVPPARDPALDTSAPTTEPDPLAFIDPCITDTAPCAGLRAVVQKTASAEPLLDPLRISLPVSGADGFAAQCDSIQEGDVPDTLLTPATRPTVAVVVNQPSTLALTGQWADGAAFDKTTMVTSPSDDAEWKRSWDQERVQRNIVACLTLPLEIVRAHARAGVGELRANVLAISATGRAEISAQVTLNIPTDGDNTFFAERLVIADRGEQRRSDGVLYPTVHVHYAFLTDTLVSAGSGLDPAATHVYAEHAFVEGADCSGWAVNRQGRDRTSGALMTVVSEERSVAGRPRNVTVVDGEVYLNPDMPSGWEGHFCMRLIATDEPPGTPGAASREPLTLALRGTKLRSPRTADYAISVLLDGADRQFRATWATPSGVTLCTEAALTTAEAGATCALSARSAVDGVWVTVSDAAAPLVSARIPINTAYCNSDDPFGVPADGCSRGFTQPLEVPLGTDGTVRVVLQVDRTTEVGMLWQDPSQAWKVGPIVSFTS